jgi:RNA polymerase subunit RPABC4/transcription elongation factor Spt4
MTYECPKCHYELYERLKYCPECGFDFTVGQKKCPKCRMLVSVDSPKCPQCGLDFEKWAFMVPRVIALSIVAIILVLAGFGPIVWKSQPWLHDKGKITEGMLLSEVGGTAMIPMFINWKTGERYILVSAEQSNYGGNTEYMNNLIPLPPEVVFHYDIPLGEEVWIIRRANGNGNNVWLQVGRWGQRGKPWKYGWVHAGNIQPIE